MPSNIWTSHVGKEMWRLNVSDVIFYYQWSVKSTNVIGLVTTLNLISLIYLTGLPSTKPTCTSLIVHFESLSSCPEADKVHLTCLSTKCCDEDRNHTHTFFRTSPFHVIHLCVAKYVKSINKEKVRLLKHIPFDQGQC